VTRDPLEQLADALPPAALVTRPACAVLPELPVASPAGDGEWQAALALARSERWRVLPLGHGTKLGWGAPPDVPDLILSTARATGIQSYEPGDGTLRARAGTTMAALEDAAHGGGHRVTPAVPHPARATVGGVVAAGRSGADRLRFGPTRHHVLGVRALLADGSIAKSGGQLVKNVTGYDLHRLYTGSRGTLCVLLDVALRLFPLPRETRVLRATVGTRTAALDLAQEVLALPMQPTAVALNGAAPQGAFTVEVVLDGHEAVVADAAKRTADVLPASEELGGATAMTAWHALRDREDGAGRPVVALSTRPSRMRAALDAVDAAADRAGVPLRVEVHPGLATATLHVERDDAPLVPLLTELAELARSGTALTGRDLPGEARAAFAALASAGPGLELGETLRRALDPESRFAGSAPGDVR
jgi:glycolate oxidase FAD binding subunit